MNAEPEISVEFWPVDRPRPFPRNARTITDAAVDKVASSIREFGWRQPIVVDVEGVVVVGHVRLMAARKLGLPEVPVHVAGNLTPNQIKTYRLMDNRSHEESGWNLQLLGQEMTELQELNFDVSLTGFDGPEISALFDSGTGPSESSDTADAPTAAELRCPKCGSLQNTEIEQ